MSPRLAEGIDSVLRRIKAGKKTLDTSPVAFGSPHFSRAVLLQEGRYRVRFLVTPPEKAEAYLREHGMFMPEHSEMLAEPIGPIELDCATFDELISALKKSKYEF